MLLIVGVGLGMLITATTVYESGPGVFQNAVATAITSLLPGSSGHRATAKELTTQLLGAKTKTAQIKIAKERRATMKLLAQTDPQAFLDAALSNTARAALPAEVQAELEQEAQVEGVLTTTIADVTNGSGTIIRERTIYSLTENTGTRVSVHPVQGAIDAASGSTLRVQGTKIDDQMVLAEAGPATVEALVTVAPASSVGNQRLIALMVNFSDSPAQPFTAADIQNKLFGATNSANAYYTEASFGKTTFSGDVKGWLTINPGTATFCDYKAWEILADQAAAAQGIDLSGYPRRVYAFANRAVCGNGGWGSLGGSPSTLALFGDYSLNSLVHELGHNLGVHHASLKTCGAKAIDVYSNCHTSEYGDLLDVMGTITSYVGVMNGVHKYVLGWFDASQVVTPVSGTAYTLTSINNPSGLKMLRIPKADTGESYYLSYRGSDGGAFAQAQHATYAYYYTGAEIHIWNGIPTNRTYLIDANPPFVGPTGSINLDMPLKDGVSFVDTINKITITQVSHDANGVTIIATYSGGGGAGKTSTKGGGRRK